MESRGVFLMTFGKPQYGWMAYQLGMSLKYYSPSVPIHLLTDQSAISKLNQEQMKVFDAVTYFETPSDPALAKIQMYDHLPFDHTLWLDADGLCMQPIEPLFDTLIVEDKPFRCFVHDYYDQHSPEVFPQMYWANKSTIWNHYGFNTERLPATQSSVLYIRKGEFCQTLYQKMGANYANRILVEQLREKWGGGQPDELYLNVTLAQLGYDPQMEQVIYFANDLTLRPHQAKDQYYILSLFGPLNYVKPVYEREYDKVVKSLGIHFGGLPTYAWKGIKTSKHANIRQVMNKRSAFKGKFIRHERLTQTVVPQGRTLLFTSYFQSGEPSRQGELNRCLQHNIELSDIDHIYMISEVDRQPQGKVTVRVQARPTYADLVRLACDVAQENDMVIIANSDIYFNHTLNFVHQYDLNGVMLALSRWDMLAGRPRLFAYEHSQDTWIFRGPPKIQGGDYYMGLPGCDNRFAHDGMKSGYKVLNVAKDIHTFHLHESNIRSYTQKDRLLGDYMPVYITSIRDLKQLEPV
jgi:hypothetical protein